MAVTTRNRRMALIGLGSPVPRVLPNPDGSFGNVNDRLMLAFLYPIYALASGLELHLPGTSTAMQLKPGDTALTLGGKVSQMSLQPNSTALRLRSRSGNLSLKKVP